MANTKKYVSLDKLGLYDEKLKAKMAADDKASLDSAKEYADGLATNYDAAGAAATAKTEANTYTDTEIGKVNEVAAGIKTTAEKGVADAATAKGAADKAQGDVDALKTYVGTIPSTATAKDVVAYVDEKTANIASDATVNALIDRVAQAETDIDNIEKDYLKAADKTELEGEIAAAKSAGDDAKTYAEGVAGDLADEVKARGDADAALGGRIETLEGQITGLSGAMHFKGVKDSVPADGTGYEQGDVIIVGNKEYVLNGSAFVEFGDASVNAEAITALTARVDTADGKISTAEGKITALEGSVATKAEQTALDSAVETLEGADTELSNRITTLEGKFGDGEGSVADMIADAKQEAIDAAATDATTKANAAESNAKGYTDTEIDKVEATIATLTETVGTKAAQADLNALASRVTTAEGKVSTLETEMDAVEALAAANKSAHEANAAAIALKAAQTDLDAVSGRVTTLEAWHQNFVECSQEDINGLFA